VGIDSTIVIVTGGSMSPAPLASRSARYSARAISELPRERAG